MIPDHFPLDRYFCLLDDQPDEFVPLRTMRLREGAGALMFNPLSWFAWRGPAPPDMATRIGSREGLFDTPWVVWVDDPGTRSLSPFWLGPEMAHLLVDKAPGQAVDGSVSGRNLAILCDAQVIVSADHVDRRRRQWSDWSRYYADYFRRGYVAMDTLVHPFQLGALRRYFRRKIADGDYALGGTGSPGRFLSYDDPIAAFFHRQLTSMVGDVAQALLDPSSNRVSVFRGGADQEPHAGRSSSEYSLTLAIDAAPDPEERWRLEMIGPDAVVPVDQDLGDGLFYRGRILRPRRARLTPGRTTISMQFEFVDRVV